MTAHVAVGISAGGRRFGGKMNFAAGRQEVARQRAGGCQKHVFGAIGIGIRRQLVIELFGQKTPAADIFFDQLLRQGRFADLAGTQIYS